MGRFLYSLNMHITKLVTRGFFADKIRLHSSFLRYFELLRRSKKGFLCYIFQNNICVTLYIYNLYMINMYLGVYVL